MEAVQMEAARATPQNVEDGLATMGTLQKRALVCAFRNIYWLMKEEIPHTAKFGHLQELMTLQGVSILNNLNHGENNKATSQRFIQETVLTVGNQVRSDHLEKKKASPYFTILVDETTDIATVSEMIVYIRFLEDGMSRTVFLSVLPLKDGKAETIFNTLISFIEDSGLDIQKL
ncbi:uncharacterized protein LOC127861738 [Dreissena polymorpha]|uniref:DUF4371 domain-containing protein n=1 Tax=Dreissena polymorpha TaxID=45954 RepID=A0A9D4BKC6_DREPO|nr:uncharacterized protein LOC127861738 [Dreissena polymorpha]KAH3696443.1 hypothetical protein DPMN_083908 [Dreissena polymorpha]